MLLPYTTLEYYGQCAAALVDGVGVADVVLAEPHQLMRPALDVPALGDAPLLRPYRGRAFALTIDAQGLVHAATPHQRKRAGLSVLVSALSQDDVTGAVLESVVEGTLTLRQALRLLLAVAVGKTDINTSGPSPVVTFRDTADSKNRVTATMSGSERASVTLDPD